MKSLDLTLPNPDCDLRATFSEDMTDSSRGEEDKS